MVQVWLDFYLTQNMLLHLSIPNTLLWHLLYDTNKTNRFLLGYIHISKGSFTQLLKQLEVFKLYLSLILQGHLFFYSQKISFSWTFLSYCNWFRVCWLNCTLIKLLLLKLKIRSQGTFTTTIRFELRRVQSINSFFCFFLIMMTSIWIGL